ncbi:MAG: hypothetical protein J2P47_08845, partial [Acetobacteraceae bacterium]|nr:hypothetical protein [Acetobacteraceae bacterium]
MVEIGDETGLIRRPVRQGGAPLTCFAAARSPATAALSNATQIGVWQLLASRSPRGRLRADIASPAAREWVARSAAAGSAIRRSSDGFAAPALNSKTRSAFCATSDARMQDSSRSCPLLGAACCSPSMPLRDREELTLTVEHRAAAGMPTVNLELIGRHDALALQVPNPKPKSPNQ